MQKINLTENRSKIKKLSPELTFAPDRMKTIFNKALEVWKNTYDREEFIRKINLFIQTLNTDNIISKDQIDYFIAVRKAGKSLVTAYHFFNKDSGSGAIQIKRRLNTLKDILKLLGQLKDTHQKEPSNRIKLKNLSVAKNLRRLVLVKKINNFNLVPTTTELYVKKFKMTIMSLMKINNKVLLVPEFHEIKKNFKHINNLLELCTFIDPNNQKIKHLSQQAKKVYVDFCKIHDEYSTLKIFKFWKYKKKQTKVDKEIRDKVINFLNLLFDSAT